MVTNAKKGVIPALYVLSVIALAAGVMFFDMITFTSAVVFVVIAFLVVAFQFLVSTIGAKSEENMREPLTNELANFYVTKMGMAQGDALNRANQQIEQYGVVEMSIELEKTKRMKI